MNARVLALAALALVAAAGAHAYERFFGRYEGQAITANDGELEPRDVEVSISAAEEGFNVTWTSVIYKANGRVKRAKYSIDFRPSQREGIYRSAMRKNLFGQAVPLDPMRGEPYVWARIEGDTLTVYALHVTDEGGYEMQTYERTLIPEGLVLEYTSVRDGELQRTITGTLARVDG